MRRSLLLLLVAAVTTVASADLSACGDKYLRLAGRLGPSYQAEHRATVLIYMPAGSVVPPAARRLGLHQTLSRAGHRVYAVETEADLDTTLRDRRYDIVIADAAMSDALSRRLLDSPGSPTVVPVFHKQDDAANAGRKQGRCLIASNERAYYAAAEVDHVMELRRRATATP